MDKLNIAIEKEPAFAILKERSLLLFFFTVFISNSGSWLQNAALSWLSLSLQNTPLSLGIITFLGAIPSLLFSTIGGYMADKLNKRNVLLLCQVLSMTVALSIGIGVYFNVVNFQNLAAVSFINGIATAISYPVYFTLLTELVEAKNIPRVISIHSLQFNLSRLTGPVMFGFFVYMVGLGGCFIINAATYLPFIYLLLRLKGYEYRKDEKKEGIITNLQQGVHYLFSSKNIFYTILMIFTYSLLVLPYLGMMPYIVKNFLKDDPKLVGFILAVIGCGAILGAFVLTFLSRDVGDVFKRFIFSGLVFSISIFLLSLSINVYAKSVFAFLFGALMVFFYASGNSYIQMVSRSEMRGRITGFFTSVYLGIYPLGVLIMGWFSEHIDIRLVMQIQSAASLALLFLFLFLLNGKTTHSRLT